MTAILKRNSWVTWVLQIRAQLSTDYGPRPQCVCTRWLPLIFAYQSTVELGWDIWVMSYPDPGPVVNTDKTGGLCLDAAIAGQLLHVHVCVLTVRYRVMQGNENQTYHLERRPLPAPLAHPNFFPET